MGARPADVEDIAQEVFVIVHRKLPTYVDRGRLTSWLYGICRGALRDHRKRAYRRREEPVGVPRDEGLEPMQESEVAFRRTLEDLEDVLARLDDDKRIVFFLYEVEELTMSEIADAVGCPLQTGYTRLHAARAYVLERMRERGAR
jgi:RNA polymerase sigma-70 factor (ECF subfamily)